MLFEAVPVSFPEKGHFPWYLSAYLRLLQLALTLTISLGIVVTFDTNDGWLVSNKSKVFSPLVVVSINYLYKIIVVILCQKFAIECSILIVMFDGWCVVWPCESWIVEIRK